MKKIIVFISLLLTAFSFIDSQIAYGQVLRGSYSFDTIYTPNFKIKDLGNSTISVSNYCSRDFKERDSSSILGYVHLNNIKHIILEDQPDCSCQRDTIEEHITIVDGLDMVFYNTVTPIQKITRPLCQIGNEFRKGEWYNEYLRYGYYFDDDESKNWYYTLHNGSGSERYLNNNFVNNWNWDQIESITIPESIASIHWEAFVDCSKLERVVVYGKPKFAHHRVVTEVEPQYLDILRNKGNRFCRIRAIGDTMPVEFDSRLYDLDKQVMEAKNYSTIYINGFNDDSTFVVHKNELRFNSSFDTIYNSEANFWDISSIIKNSGKVFDIVIAEDCFYPNIYYPTIGGFQNARTLTLPSSVRLIRDGEFMFFKNLTDITLNGFTKLYDNIYTDSEYDISTMKYNYKRPTIHVHKKYLKKYKKAYPKNIFVAIEEK